MSPSAFVNLVLNALTVSWVVLGGSLCVSTSSSVCLSMLPCVVGFLSLVIETDKLISSRHDVLPWITVQKPNCSATMREVRAQKER